MLLNFKPGYSPDSSDFLADKLSTRLAEESITLWLAKNVDGQLLPYACGAHPWEMSMLRVRESWWRKHKAEFTLLAESRCSSGVYNSIKPGFRRGDYCYRLAGLRLFGQ